MGWYTGRTVQNPIIGFLGCRRLSDVLCEQFAFIGRTTALVLDLTRPLTRCAVEPATERTRHPLIGFRKSLAKSTAGHENYPFVL